MRFEISSVKKENTVYLIISVLAFFYIFFRAINVDLTYDEAWTFRRFVPLNTFQVINYSPCDANNHIINTLLIKLFYFFGPQNVFMGRLPNVLAGALYLYYSYKISKFLTGYAMLSVFILLVFNPFLLDFFSLARGYGLGLGFQATSIYHLLSFIKNKELRSANYALIFSSLAVLSNFSQLNYWVASLLALSYVAFYIHKENKLRFFIYQAVISACLILIIYEPVRKLVKTHNLYYGGDVGFYPDTLVSLTKYTQYSAVINNYTLIALNIFLVLVSAGICFLIIKNIKKCQSLAIENALLILLSFAVLSSLIQHYLLGTLYLIDRTALFYFPLFILVLCFTYGLMSGIIKKIFFSFILLFFGLNFIINANGYKTALWYFDSHTTSILSRINAKGAEQHKKMTVDFSWPFQSTAFYYAYKNNYPFVNLVKDTIDREALNPAVDYYIFLNKGLEKVGYDPAIEKILQLKKDTLLFYKEEEVYLFGNLR